ncbi:MAG: hypothetical protein AAGG01_00860 [Planctomycetota bacterium]
MLRFQTGLLAVFAVFAFCATFLVHAVAGVVWSTVGGVFLCVAYVASALVLEARGRAGVHD